MLVIDDLRTTAGEFHLEGVSITAEAGSYGVLLGPPGSGKSVLVETICGLRTATSGMIEIDGEDVTGLPPRRRSVGYVPQDYVLFPAARVIDNITYGVRVRERVSRKQAAESVNWVVDLLGIGDLLERWPETLSGGEKQRVALARALAIRPRLLLLDEPVSALDEGLRERVCRDLRHFQRELGITTLHISHNQEEALAVSDWAAVMSGGSILQRGTMHKLLRRPHNEAVARFLRSENILPGVAEPAPDGGGAFHIAGHVLRVPQECRGDAMLVVRPESLKVAEAGTTSGNAIPAKLIDIADRGIYMRLDLDAGVPLVAYVVIHEWHPEFVPGREYAVVFPPDKLHVISA